MTHSLKKNKNPLGKKFLIGGVGILLLLGSCFLVWENIKFFQKEKDLSSIINGYSDQINKLQNSNQDLKEKIGNYQDPNYIEKIAREEGYGIVFDEWEGKDKWTMNYRPQ